MNFPKHEAYKDTDSKWLKKIPLHWKELRLKNVSERNVVGIAEATTHAYSDDGIPILRATNIREGKIIGEMLRIDPDFAFAKERRSKIIHEGDLVSVRTGNAGKTVLIGSATGECHCFTMLITTPNQLSSGKYLEYVINSQGSQEYFSVEGWGTAQLNISVPILQNLPIAVPSLEEQSAIANFLDQETAKIDALITEQERLIELLQEKRQAVISHAVTKGLNPGAPMKDSGVEWLGEVPEHWAGCRFKHCLMGLTDAEHKTCPDYEEGEYLIIRTSNIREGVLITEGGKYTDANGYKEWTTRCTPKEGDIVFTREAPAGEACIIPEGVTVCLGQRTVLMHPRSSKVTPEYLVSSIYSGAAKTFIQNLSQGSTVSHLNMSEIGNMPIALPPLEEQLQINKYTRDKSRKFDDLMKQARTSIELLQERRSALISAAVTGQIDVRGLVSEEEAA